MTTRNSLGVQLSAFLTAHPYSRLDKISKPKQADVIISPWGDDSLILHIDPDAKDVISVLNGVILPERFSAVYHKETQRLEVIYTAFELSAQLKDRSFQFEYGGTDFMCEFAPCSNELLRIAEHLRPSQKPTTTDYRNMMPIGIYAAKKKGSSLYGDVPVTHPTSFWVSRVNWDEALVIALARHINFYMAYYDTTTPIILFHTAKTEGISVQPQTQFRHGAFPKTIKARPLDDEILHFWHASRLGDPARRLVYNYQILEYLAHYILEGEIRCRMRKALSAPHVLDDLDGLVDDMLDAAISSKMHDTQKVELLLTRAVDPQIVWNEVRANISFFEKPTIFENGFEIRALAKAGWGPADFATVWPAQFAKALRDIRNGLSHAKESRMEKGIPPTKESLRKLQPWTTLASVAATEAILYRSEALR